MSEYGQNGNESEEYDEKPTVNLKSLKRKLSQSATPVPTLPTTVQIAPVAPPPMLLPVERKLLPSNFEFYICHKTHPQNKLGFRYYPCGPSTSVPGFRTHRLIESQPQKIRFSWEDKSAFTFMTEDAKTITTDKGWRMARSNIALRQGNWYWEFKIEKGGESDTTMAPATRVGISRRESPFNAPVGFDGYSYCYRDLSGEALTLSRGKKYGKPFKTGSTIGVFLSLPPRKPPTDHKADPSRIMRKRAMIAIKNQLWYECFEYTASREMDALVGDPNPPTEKEQELPKGKKTPKPVDPGPPPRPIPILKGSKLAFFVDGEYQGIAYEDLYDYIPLKLHSGQWGKKVVTGDPRENFHDDGILGYFPSASVFQGGIVSINPGPDFDFPPPQDLSTLMEQEEPVTWKPLSDRYKEYYEEQAFMDDCDEQSAIDLYTNAIYTQCYTQKIARKKSKNTTLSEQPCSNSPEEDLVDVTDANEILKKDAKLTALLAALGGNYEDPSMINARTVGMNLIDELRLDQILMAKSYSLDEAVPESGSLGGGESPAALGLGISSKLGSGFGLLLDSVESTPAPSGPEE